MHEVDNIRTEVSIPQLSQSTNSWHPRFTLTPRVALNPQATQAHTPSSVADVAADSAESEGSP